jgi:hypothetical protein
MAWQFLMAAFGAAAIATAALAAPAKPAARPHEGALIFDFLAKYIHPAP